MIALFTGIADFLLKVLIPLNEKDDIEDNWYVMTESKGAAYAGGWSCFLMICFQNCLTVNSLEGHSWNNVVILLPGLLLSIIFQVCSQFILGETTNLPLIMSCGDVLNCAISFGVYASQFMKYYKLNKLNAVHSLKTETASIK